MTDAPAAAPSAVLPQLTAVLGRGVVPSPTPRTPSRLTSGLRGSTTQSATLGDTFSPPLVISADDTGLTRGDGCFDATRVVTDEQYGSRVDHLEAHLARFARSAAALELPPLDLAAWREFILDAVDHWGVPGEAVLKFMVTRGNESVPGDITGALTITPISAAVVAQRAGIPVVTLSRGTASDAYADAPWLLGGVKSLSYAINQAAKREATRRGAKDVLFTSTDGYALEGPTSALITRLGDTLVTTPAGPTGILASITQQVVFEAAALDGWVTEQRLVTPAEIVASGGAWLVSSVRGSTPIRTLDGAPVTADPELDARIAAYAGF